MNICNDALHIVTSMLCLSHTVRMVRVCRAWATTLTQPRPPYAHYEARSQRFLRKCLDSPFRVFVAHLRIAYTILPPDRHVARIAACMPRLHSLCVAGILDELRVSDDLHTLIVNSRHLPVIPRRLRELVLRVHALLPELYELIGHEYVQCMRIECLDTTAITEGDAAALTRMPGLREVHVSGDVLPSAVHNLANLPVRFRHIVCGKEVMAQALERTGGATHVTLLHSIRFDRYPTFSALETLTFEPRHGATDCLGLRAYTSLTELNVNGFLFHQLTSAHVARIVAEMPRLRTLRLHGDLNSFRLDCLARTSLTTLSLEHNGPIALMLSAEQAQCFPCALVHVRLIRIFHTSTIETGLRAALRIRIETVELK